MHTFLDSIKKLLNKLPQSWVDLTTHRLDIYNESKAKSEFLDELKKLIAKSEYTIDDLEQLPTAYDYIRLGHQLSSLLEWVLAEINNVSNEQIISFSSRTMPLLSILRQNKLNNKATTIYYDGNNPPLIDEPRLQDIYGYHYTLQKITNPKDIPQLEGTVVFVTQKDFDKPLESSGFADITLNIHPTLGSVMLIHQNEIQSISAIQHVRRRETIAMTPPNALNLLKEIVHAITQVTTSNTEEDKQIIFGCIKENTGSELQPLIASSGLSIQYAMLMGLVENAMTQHPDKEIKIILPPNCYGGTNDQSRRIADLMDNVEIVDMHVDGGQNLVSSLDEALESVANTDGVALILAEIPTNPRVEVPDMDKLAEVLTRKRLTQGNILAIEPFFMVDQTFCPNVQLLHQASKLKDVQTISFASGSKFPSGGRCIGGYCAANYAAKDLLPLISSHLELSDNQANAHQLHTLAENMPSMPSRIVQAYLKTRDLVNNIQNQLPEAKIYYVSEAMVKRGFMPSVFSLDLPTNGDSEKQKLLNIKLIEFMINAHPKMCKNCVSYGQLKGSYWTIPATSTQGTTKEEDKDYIVRVALAPDVDVELLSQSFAQFCKVNSQFLI